MEKSGGHFLARAVRVVVDVEGARVGGRVVGVEAETGFEPGPGCDFDVGRREGDRFGGAVVPGRGEL